MLAGQLVISEDSTKAFSCFIELWPFFFKMCLLLPCTKTLQVLLRVENSVCGLASFLACLDFISKLRPDLQNRVHMAGGSRAATGVINQSSNSLPGKCLDILIMVQDVVATRNSW